MRGVGSGCTSSPGLAAAERLGALRTVPPWIANRKSPHAFLTGCAIKPWRLAGALAAGSAFSGGLH